MALKRSRKPWLPVVPVRGSIPPPSANDARMLAATGPSSRRHAAAWSAIPATGANHTSVWCSGSTRVSKTKSRRSIRLTGANDDEG